MLILFVNTMSKYYKDCVLDLNTLMINYYIIHVYKFAEILKSLLHNKVVKMIILNEIHMTVDNIL